MKGDRGVLERVDVNIKGRPANHLVQAFASRGTEVRVKLKAADHSAASIF
jgi:hypothetical protein